MTVDDPLGLTTEGTATPPSPPPPAPSHKPTFAEIIAAIDRFPNTPVAKALAEFAQLPSEGVNAALGIPQRIMAERIGDVRQHPGAVAATTALGLGLGPASLAIPSVREQAGRETHAAFHPNDLGPEQRAEQATGASHLMSDDPGIWHKLQNFLVRTGFETLTDPLTFTGAGTEVAGEHTLEKMGQLMTDAMRSDHAGIQNTARSFGTNVEDRLGGHSPAEVETINAIRNRGITRSRVQQTADEELLHSERKNLAQGIISPRLRQRFLQEPYVYGTPTMRRQAVTLGYTPTPEEAARAPLGLFDYNLRANYDPHTGIIGTPTNVDSLLLGKRKRLLPPEPGFQKPQVGTVSPTTLAERVAKRLASGRANAEFIDTSNHMQQHLGVGKEIADAMSRKAVHGGLEPLKAVSQAQVDALLASGIPHMRNIGVLGYLSMGEGGIARAIQFFTLGIPKKFTSRLEEGGASHFGIRTPAKYSPARLLPRPGRRVTTGALDRWDSAVRAARLEQLDKTASHLPELQKLNRVNQDLGAYNQRPEYVNWLSGIGANFPQWHNYVVPTTVGRALLRQPGRVERLGRVEQNANDALAPNAKHRLSLGGPVDEMASAAADPVRIAQGKYPTYFAGPSSIGPLSYALSHGYPVKMSERVLGAASGFVPFGNVLLDATMNQFKSPLPPLPRAAASLAGIYTQKRPPGSMARTAQHPKPPPTSRGVGSPEDPLGITTP